MQVKSVLEGSGKATVVMGNLPVEVRLADLAPMGGSAVKSPPKKGRRVGRQSQQPKPDPSRKPSDTGPCNYVLTWWLLWTS